MTFHHRPNRGPDTAWGASRPAGVRSNGVTGLAIVPDGVHPSIQQVNNFAGVVG